MNCCRDRSLLKRNAFICELSAEMEQCIPAPDDVECRIDDMALSDAIKDFSANRMRKKGIFLFAGIGIWILWLPSPNALLYLKAK